MFYHSCAPAYFAYTYAMEDTTDKIEVAGLRLDLRNQRLEQQGRVVELRPKSWELLKYMAARPAQLLGKEELVQAVWGDTVVTDASLNQAVRELRKALGDDARSPRYIETVHRRGFRFLVEPAGAEGAIAPLQVGSQLSGLFGRSQDISTLNEILASAMAGQRQLCFVTGEPGIGKTSLVREFLGSLAEHPAARPLVGWGQCIDQMGEGEPYLPILEALDRLARGPAGAEVREHLRRCAPMWLVQMPWLLPADHAYDSQLLAATPTRMLREFCIFLETLAADTPLVLWLEDLHWSDRATINLLDALSRRQESARLLILVSYRPVDAAIRHAPVRQLKQSLLQQGKATELSLELLTRDAVAEYLASRVEDEGLLASLTGLICELSDGNPLFMVTLVDYLIAKQVLVRGEGGWSLQSSLEAIRKTSPQSLLGIIELQLEQASAQEIALLETASVLGTRFPAQALAGMLEQELDSVELVCDQLAEHYQFLVATGSVEWPDNSVGQGYLFLHDVYRRVLYDRLSPARRQHLHLLAGRTIEAGYPAQIDEVTAELALHFEIGRNPQRAVYHLRLAAERAQQRAAAGEAVGYLNRALLQVAEFPNSVESEECELELRLFLSRVLITAVAYTGVEPEQNLQRALELCEHLDAWDSEHILLTQQSLSLLLQGDIEAAEHTLARARKTLKSIDDPVLLSHERVVSGISALVRGQLPTAEKRFKHGVELLADVDLRESVRLFGHDSASGALGFSALSAWVMGRPQEAQRRAKLALSRAESIGIPQVQAIALDLALSVEHLRRDVKAARPLADALDACLDKYSVEYPYCRPICSRNWLLLQTGDSVAAMASMRRDIENMVTARAGLFFPLMYITMAEACLAAGTVMDGLEAIDKALLITSRGERLLEAEVWRLKGELLRLDEKHEQAEQCYRTALTVADEQSALALELRAATSLARLQRDTGLAADAGERLQNTLDRFTEGFDDPDLRDARELLTE